MKVLRLLLVFISYFSIPVLISYMYWCSVYINSIEILG